MKLTCLIIWSFRICVRRKTGFGSDQEELVSDHHHKDVINETWILEPFPNSLEIEDPKQDEMIKEPVKEPYYGLDIIANWKTKDSYMNFVEPIGYIDPEPELTNPYLPDNPELEAGNFIVIPTRDFRKTKETIINFLDSIHP